MTQNEKKVTIPISHPKDLYLTEICERIHQIATEYM